jgi:hypothetical protein
MTEIHTNVCIKYLCDVLKSANKGMMVSFKVMEMVPDLILTIDTDLRSEFGNKINLYTYDK